MPTRLTTAKMSAAPSCRASPRADASAYDESIASLERAREAQDGYGGPLTPRELEVVKLIAEAYTNEQIAEALVISRKTVERHRANILEKLGMRDRVELTRYAIRRGLIVP